ncbi:hypothetical protein Pelo_11567 [Pelomyxa schiedti]|nr:hypothetical protein Pelo_11567 [Pelomyxa schiedti]
MWGLSLVVVVVAAAVVQGTVVCPATEITSLSQLQSMSTCTEIDGDLKISCCTGDQVTKYLGVLENVTGYVDASSSNFQGSVLKLPALKYLGNINYNSKTLELNFPALESAYGLTIFGHYVTTLNFPALQTVTTHARFYNLLAVKSVSLPNLVSAATLYISIAPYVNYIYLPKFERTTSVYYDLCGDEVAWTWSLCIGETDVTEINLPSYTTGTDLGFINNDYLTNVTSLARTNLSVRNLSFADNKALCCSQIVNVENTATITGWCDDNNCASC